MALNLIYSIRVKLSKTLQTMKKILMIFGFLILLVAGVNKADAQCVNYGYPYPAYGYGYAQPAYGYANNYGGYYNNGYCNNGWGYNRGYAYHPHYYGGGYNRGYHHGGGWR